MDIEKYSPLDEYFTSHQNYSELKEAQVWFNYESDVSSPKPRYTQKEAKVFKIQVQISDDFNSIKENKNKISQLFPDKTITINFDQPFYKLRIGNFISRKEATEFLKALESNGYIGCRIIEESN